VAALRGVLAVSLLSADTFGRLDAIAAELQVEAQRLLGPEGLAVSALLHADVLVASIDDALDLLLNPKRLLATLRH
jgi:hypothetical protein